MPTLKNFNYVPKGHTLLADFATRSIVPLAGRGEVGDSFSNHARSLEQLTFLQHMPPLQARLLSTITINRLHAIPCFSPIARSWLAYDKFKFHNVNLSAGSFQKKI